MFGSFFRPGKASFICGGQWGSEGKGAAAAALAKHLSEVGRHFTHVTTNAGVQSGHTSVHNGKTQVFFHLPTYPAIAAQYGYKPIVYLNAGSVIDVGVLFDELSRYHDYIHELAIHPDAAIVTDECKVMEMRPDGQQTKIGSTRKGVGAAIATKVLRAGVTAKDIPALKIFTRRLDLNNVMQIGGSVLAEIPQGYGLGLNAGFYPYCTSRDCTPMQAMSDAGIHPAFYNTTMMVIRTFPIRVGNITNDEDMVIGESGGCYPDQCEISWRDIGVNPEYTTVTKRVRRIFTFSQLQLTEAMAALRPTVVYVTFLDYYKPGDRFKVEDLMLNIRHAAINAGIHVELIAQYGPSTDDARLWSIKL